MLSGASADRGLRLVTFLGDEMQTLDLPAAGTISIGREQGSTLCLRDPSVSRRHALLHVGRALCIEDLASANGTRIRDSAGAVEDGDTLDMRHLVGKKAEIAVGQTVLIGTACVVVQRRPAPLEPTLGGAPLTREPGIQSLYADAERVARSPINVLLLGETGVGKDVLARAIHAWSGRASGPFLAVNCAALTESLLESELFGHEKGAFTGAIQARAGLFEAAAGGTVLLDEVGELAPAAQAKLLRVLEERVVVRLGATRPRPIDVRLLAATNRELEQDAEAGRFRQDLYFRLNGIAFSIPPLRKRQADILPLAEAFIADACRSMDRADHPLISAQVRELLLAHAWPGNVRELRHAMERALVLCSGHSITPAHLPEALRRSASAASRSEPAPGSSPARTGTATNLPSEIRSIERVRIEEALGRCGGIQSEAAKVLGISRRTLISRIEAFGLPRPRKRDPAPDG